MRSSTELVVPHSETSVVGSDSRRFRDVGRRLPDSGPSLREFWLHLVGGDLRLAKHFAGDDKVYLVAESQQPGDVERARLSDRELAVFCRLLAGQSQKATSYELGLSPSTVATHAARAFGKLNLQPTAVPLALILIGQAACDAIELRDVRITTNSKEGQRHVVASVPRPPQNHLAQLTTAERAIALALVDGLSKFDIARARSTSVHTIGRQVSSIFAKLNVKGRFDLICRMSQ